jgi:hypothetical protein
VFKDVLGGIMKYFIFILMIMTIFCCEAEYSYNPIISDEPSSSQNHPPKIIQITANPQISTLSYNDQDEGSTTPIILTVYATDKDGDPLSYYWFSEFCRITRRDNYNTKTNPTQLYPPIHTGTFEVECTVSDGKETDFERLSIEVVTQ